MKKLTTKQIEVLAAGRTKGSEASRVFTDEQETSIRTEYEAGAECPKLAKKYNVSKDCIYRAIRRAGGDVCRRPRKYFRNGSREKQLNQTFGLSAFDMDFLHKHQSGLCLWCKALLPKDSLRCTVDHKHQEVKTRNHLRSQVRGICCPDGHCNRIAGMVERGINLGPLFSSFIRHVEFVISTNSGIFKGEAAI